MFTHHPGGCDKWRRMYFAASGTVAVADEHIQAAYLVVHAFAEATSIQWVSHNVLPVQGRGIIIAYNLRLRII
jgi:hypothetical protein